MGLGILSSLAPERIRRRLRALAASGEQRDAGAPIWEGVYERFGEVPASGEGHEGEEWIQGTLAEAERLLAGAKAGTTIPAGVTEERSLLPLLASIASERNGGRVRILDFGGGAGADFVRVLLGVPGCAGLDYHIVETEGVCRAGRRLFAGEARLQFHSRLPEALPRPDIVHLCSALQYVEDYEGFLSRLSALGAAYMLFVKLSAGDVQTFATAQKNVGRSSIPYWFLNVGEVVGFMARRGYTLAFKGSLSRTYDQAGIRPDRRVPRLCNLLFVRRGDGPG